MSQAQCDSDNRQLYNEYSKLFTPENKQNAEEAQGVFTGTEGGIAVALKIFKNELLVELNQISEQEKKNNLRVALLHDDRIKSSEGNYISITTKDGLERIMTWKPQTWYGLWVWYVVFAWHMLKYYSRMIIHLPIFEI